MLDVLIVLCSTRHAFTKQCPQATFADLPYPSCYFDWGHLFSIQSACVPSKRSVTSGYMEVPVS